MIKPLEYGEEFKKMNFEEAEKKYNEILDEFERVKKQYPKTSGIIKRKMKKDDIKTLNDCIGVLLPLGLTEPVQDELKEKKKDDTLWYEIGQLNMKIMAYESRFRNTGVKLIGEAPPGF